MRGKNINKNCNWKYLFNCDERVCAWRRGLQVGIVWYQLKRRMFQDDSALCGCQICVVDVPVEYDIAAVTIFCRLPVVLVQIEGLCRPIWCVTLVNSIRT